MSGNKLCKFIFVQSKFQIFKQRFEIFRFWSTYILGVLENWLEHERDQLPLWVPVGIGTGIVVWQSWGAWIWPILLMVCALLVLAGIFIGLNNRLSILLIAAALTVGIGFAAIQIKSSLVASPVLEKIWIGEFYARITRVEDLAARGIVRLELETGSHDGLPSKVRVNLKKEQLRAGFEPGAIIRLRARLMPPAAPLLPDGYDFARKAWFSGLGATGSALGEVKLFKSAPNHELLSGLRTRLYGHIISEMPGASGSIAAALVTGDRGAISDADAEAMRNSGMAHLLSISGLHVTAVVGLAFLLFSRLMAAFPWLALRLRVPIVAAALAASVAIGYTVLTGAQVPTVRSCVAALLILLALSLGRDALSLRLLGFAAVFIMLLWPESLAGPSFQLSFAAVTTIIVLHNFPWMQKLVSGQNSGIIKKIFCAIFSLLLTGLAIELLLAPIALFHFHKAGLYGALANVIAIPLTTFIIMPFEALALIFDSVGLGGPFWWVAGKGIDGILWLAQLVSGLPGSVSMLPNMPHWSFGLMIFGGLGFAYFQTRLRLFGIPLFLLGAAAMVLTPRPDILLTGDGKHLAITNGHGDYALLRGRAGDYVRNALRENAGINGEAMLIEDWPGATCSPDSCIINMIRGDRVWTILATRTRYMIPAIELAAACRRVDIVISDRWLPHDCQPRLLKADRSSLKQSGGLAFYLEEGRIESVNADRSHLPWSAKLRKLSLYKAAYKNAD